MSKKKTAADLTAESLAYAEAEARNLCAAYFAVRDTQGPDAPGAAALRDLYLASCRKRDAAIRAARTDNPGETMSKKTTTTVRWEEIEAGAGEESSLETFAEALIEAAFDDNRIEAIELTPGVDLWGDTEIEVAITGRITATAFVNEVFDGEHGAW